MSQLFTLATVDKNDNFVKAVKKGLNDLFYRMSMQSLSRLHRVQQMELLDSALFWIVCHGMQR